MEKFIEILPETIASLAVIISAYLGYNQYTKNKLTDVKIDTIKKEQDDRKSELNSILSKIYGELWELRFVLDCDRVFIIQPHPLYNSIFISVNIEIARKGTSSVKGVIKELKIIDIDTMCNLMSKNDFLYYKNSNDSVPDPVAKAIIIDNGAITVAIKRLTDSKGNWIGSLVCEYLRESPTKKETILREMSEVSNIIQYTLPPL